MMERLAGERDRGEKWEEERWLHLGLRLNICPSFEQEPHRAVVPVASSNPKRRPDTLPQRPAVTPCCSAAP
jgi:hypothetical protein